jgi:hypothetical protein
MNGMIKILVRRLLPLSASFVAATVLLAFVFSRGLLSPRGLAIALLALCIFGGMWAVIIIRKTAKELEVQPGSPEASLDAVTRKRRLLGIRVGKIAIVALLLCLVLGLLRGGPLLPLLAGAIANLCIIAAIIVVVVRLQRSLH